MTPEVDDIINWTTFAETRAVLGESFVRVLGYFREDGTKSVAAIEAMTYRTYVAFHDDQLPITLKEFDQHPDVHAR